MKKTIQKFAVLFVAAMIIAPSLAFLPVSAQDNANTAVLFGGDTNMDNLKTQSLGGDANPQEIAAKIINILMGFLGLVAVVIILLGGFKWMTAAGSEDKIDEAKKLLAAGVIGLVIILSAWGVATFVINNILGATATA